MIGHRTRFRENDDLTLATDFAEEIPGLKKAKLKKDINGHFRFNGVGKPSFLQSKAREASQLIWPA